MPLTTQQRFDVRAFIGSELSNRREAFSLTKAQLDTAIAAVDDWLDANATAFNQALPVAARTALTARQKLELLYRVALRRFEVG